MQESNSQLTLNDESIELITTWLTMFAQVSRAMRRHERASKVEEVRNTIYAQHADKL